MEEDHAQSLVVDRVGTQNDWISKLLELKTCGTQNDRNSKLLELKTFGTQNLWNSTLLELSPFGTQNVWNSKLLELKTFGAQDFWSSKKTSNFGMLLDGMVQLWYGYVVWHGKAMVWHGRVWYGMGWNGMKGNMHMHTFTNKTRSAFSLIQPRRYDYYGKPW